MTLESLRWRSLLLLMVLLAILIVTALSVLLMLDDGLDLRIYFRLPRFQRLLSLPSLSSLHR